MKIIKWRWLSIIVFGVLANFLVNATFSIWSGKIVHLWDEYLVAIIFSFLILEGTRWWNLKLDKKYSWETNLAKRIISQFTSNFLLLLIIINGLGTAYMLIVFQSTYDLQEYLIINIVVATLALIILLIDVLKYFITIWRSANTDLIQSESEINELKQEVGKSEVKPIVSKLANKTTIVIPEEIVCFVTVDKTVYAYSLEGNRTLIDHTLDQLIKQLPFHLFFRINRQYIVSKDTIKGIESIENGKVKVNLEEMKNLPISLTVSRLQAAKFRKWFS